MKTNMKTLYEIRSTSLFRKQLKKIKKQGKDLKKLEVIVEKLANKEELEERYRNHMLTDNKYYKNCGECHIEPDWLLVYQYLNEELILLLLSTGSHSELF